MGDFGHNLGAEAVALFQAHETHVHATIEAKNAQVEAMVQEMEDLETFASLLRKAVDGFEEDGEHVYEPDAELMQRLASNPELNHIFEPTKFKWVEGEIKAVASDLKEKLKELSQDEYLERMIRQRVEGKLQREIGFKTEEIMHDQLELSKAMELFSNGLRRTMAEIDTILRKMSRY